MIISINTEKAFDKIQHLKLLKTLDRSGTEANYLKIIKATYEKPMSSIYLTVKNCKFFLGD